MLRCDRFRVKFLKWSLHPAGELKTLPTAPSLHRLLRGRSTFHSSLLLQPLAASAFNYSRTVYYASLHICYELSHFVQTYTGYF